MSTPTMRLLAWAETHGPATCRDLTNALTVAQRAHQGQFRRSGDPYVEHPVAVALVLADHDSTPETVIAAILHDVPEHTPHSPIEDLRVEFGDVVAHLLAEFAALDRLDDLPPGTTDPRVLQIKVADRLHNMRTIRHLLPDKQRRKAVHTRDRIAPLARNLGLDDLGTELDDLAVATLRAHAPMLLDSATPARRPATGVRALRGALSLGGLLLPAQSRHRWIQEWEGELHAADNLSERLRFAVNVLLGLPDMAVHTRRTESR